MPERAVSPPTVPTPASIAPFLDALRAALPPAAIVEDVDAIAPWLSDWRGRWHGTTPFMLAPGNTGEVVRIVTLAARYGVPLVPQGGNTSMVGGATPPADGSAVLLSLRRLNRIRALAPDHAVAEAGVVLENLHIAAAAIGARFPLTLGARGSATIGGLVSTNAGGTQVLRFGPMRALTLGLEAVLPDGSLHNGLSGLVKDNRGYSLDQLLIGAEGTLGIVTAAALRLVPVAAEVATAWVGLGDPRTALSLLRHLRDAAVAIESFEVIPGDSLKRVLAFLPDARAPIDAPAPWHALIEATGPDARTALTERLAEALEAKTIVNASIAANIGQAQSWWRLRESVSAAEKAAGPALQHDISVPVAAMPDFLTSAPPAIAAAFPDTHASGFGHLGDGNVHFHVRAPREVTSDAAARRWLEEQGPAISRMVHDLVGAAGGSISAEHGIGQMKRAELARTGGAARIGALRAIKAALDPQGLFNPGKLVPLASDLALDLASDDAKP